MVNRAIRDGKNNSEIVALLGESGKFITWKMLNFWRITGYRYYLQGPDARINHNSKVAKLPSDTRDRLNDLLERRITYKQLIEQLGDEGQHLTQVDVSNWRRTGHVEYLKQKSAWATSRSRGAPLLTVDGVSGVFDTSREIIFEALDSGDILWAWNISAYPEKRREIRILLEAGRDFWMAKQCYLKWPEVVKLILPHDKKFLTTTEIARSLNAQAEHVRQLMLHKILKPVAPGRRGIYGAMQFPTEQFITFLKERRL
jgi:hypothetical protein